MNLTMKRKEKERKTQEKRKKKEEMKKKKRKQPRKQRVSEVYFGENNVCFTYELSNGDPFQKYKNITKMT